MSTISLLGGFGGFPTVSLKITTAAINAMKTTVAFSQTLAATGGTAPYTWVKTDGMLPTGITLSTAGVLSGTPTQTTSRTFAVTVTDSTGATASKAFTVAPTVPVANTISVGAIGSGLNKVRVVMAATFKFGATLYGSSTNFFPTVTIPVGNSPILGSQYWYPSSLIATRILNNPIVTMAVPQNFTFVFVATYTVRSIAAPSITGLNQYNTSAWVNNGNGTWSKDYIFYGFSASVTGEWDSGDLAYAIPAHTITYYT